MPPPARSRTETRNGSLTRTWRLQDELSARSSTSRPGCVQVQPHIAARPSQRANHQRPQPVAEARGSAPGHAFARPSEDTTAARGLRLDFAIVQCPGHRLDHATRQVVLLSDSTAMTLLLPLALALAAAPMAAVLGRVRLSLAAPSRWRRGPAGLRGRAVGCVDRCARR